MIEEGVGENIIDVKRSGVLANERGSEYERVGINVNYYYYYYYYYYY